MIQFNFKDETDDVYARNIRYSIPGVDYTTDQILDHFLTFLRAVGYSFPINAQLVVDSDDTVYVATGQTDGSGECCGNCAGQKDTTNDTQSKFPFSDS